jgi:hypothetical protein
MCVLFAGLSEVVYVDLQNCGFAAILVPHQGIDILENKIEWAVN